VTRTSQGFGHGVQWASGAYVCVRILRVRSSGQAHSGTYRNLVKVRVRGDCDEHGRGVNGSGRRRTERVHTRAVEEWRGVYPGLTLSSQHE
jgi:hypothetical protein